MQSFSSQHKPKVMGILNVTPDSFSENGQYYRIDAAIHHALDMVQEGADILDIGGESTRPGAKPVSVDEQLQRVIPIIEALSQEINIPISIDTSEPEVMWRAVAAGAKIINDVRALQMPGALQVAARCHVSVCLMHMQGQPETMQFKPHYEDVMAEIYQFLNQRKQAALEAGIRAENIILDPGFGFGKTAEQNLLITKNLDYFKSLDCPLLLGVSRKSTIGKVLNRDVNDRLAGGLALTTLGVLQGASIIRTHDVKATVDAVNMTWAAMQV